MILRMATTSGTETTVVDYAAFFLIVQVAIFLDEVASRHPGERIVRGLDGAGGHGSASLSLAPNLRLLKLPPYAPELNPVAHRWDDLREPSFPNRLFERRDAVENHWEVALHDMELDHQRVHSRVAWPWIISSL
jgi:transposase